MRLLVTGFEPFGPSSINPSGEVVKRLQSRIDDHSLAHSDVEIRTTILPVAHSRAWEILRSQYVSLRPDVVILLGEAKNRDALSIEGRATNWYNDVLAAENAGAALLPHGSESHPSTLPIDQLVRALHQANIPAECSSDAGTYLCNEIMYLTLDYFQSQRGIAPIPQAGFIHLPWLPEQVSRYRPDSADQHDTIQSMELSMMTNGIQLCIEQCIHLASHQAKGVV